MIPLEDFIDKYKKKIELELSKEMDRQDAPDSLKKAMKYSLDAGGKRIRPLLVLATMSAFEKDCERGMKTAAALEMIHTYSLIHDDLPSMDDDDLRRGKPTNHIVFGEALAILAGDALLTQSFSLISSSDLSSDQKIRIISELAKSSGPEGMVGGQVADIEGENKQLSIDQLESIHLRKTGRLLQFAVLAGGIMSEATAAQLHHLEQYALHIGLAFQIRDDILDVEGEEEEIGKPVGSDQSRNKSTYPALLGMDKAKQKLEFHILEAKKSLSALQFEQSLLHSIADMIAKRSS
ncbi:polyprenyl synthetase family protein [Jeotgalibacillus campisalis]|uniref:Farnesyl diphosphate synthase n=1 Tax=Jeotgalibacillus campisalis TaxID=220754 RepID=A0A0C2VNB1_9BACL|nr:farnesyl diphosphate synthase [Jeotgalibacillus campisalis]KIL45941.1 geranylgeranyl pyrophosphate synthase [Jeotgalibacillus campisalis]